MKTHDKQGKRGEQRFSISAKIIANWCKLKEKYIRYLFCIENKSLKDIDDIYAFLKERMR